MGWQHGFSAHCGMSHALHGRVISQLDIPAMEERQHLGEVVRHQSCIWIHNLEGRRTNHPFATMRVGDGHDVGRNCHYYGIPPPRRCPAIFRIIYIDVRQIRWCSAGSVAFQSLAWPTFDVRKAKSFARTLWTNHSRWADVLVVRGQCLCSHNSYFRSNRVLWGSL